MENAKIEKMKRARTIINVIETLLFVLTIVVELFLKEYILCIPEPWNRIVYDGISVVWALFVIASTLITSILDKKIDGKPLWKNIDFYFFIALSSTLILMIIVTILRFCGVFV